MMDARMLIQRMLLVLERLEFEYGDGETTDAHVHWCKTCDKTFGHEPDCAWLRAVRDARTFLDSP